MSQGDNFRFDISGCDEELLLLALKVATSNYKCAVGWSQDSEKGLIFHWTDKSSQVDSVNFFPVPMNVEQLFSVVKSWLAEQDYGREPDSDGSNVKGFRVYCEACGQVGSDWSAFVAIQPSWTVFGK